MIKQYLINSSRLLLVLAVIAVSSSALTSCSKKLKSMPTREEQKPLTYPDPEWEDAINRQNYQVDSPQTTR